MIDSYSSTKITAFFLLTIIALTAFFVPLGLNLIDPSDDTPNSSANLLGDINLDNVVDVFDVGIFAGRYEQPASTSVIHQRCDLNNDGIINILDLGQLAAALGSAANPTLTNTPIPTSGNTPIPSPTDIPNPSPTTGGPPPTIPPNASTEGVWISQAELLSLPNSGAEWDAIASRAQSNDWDSPALGEQELVHVRSTLAGAYYGARLNDSAMLTRTKDAIMSAIGTENQGRGRALEVGRNLLGYIVAADVIDMKNRFPSDDATFRAWLDPLRFSDLEGRTLESCHEDRPNNWGTMCGASLIGADVYLGDTTNLAKHANTFEGFLGNRDAYAGFDFQSGAFTWMCDTNSPRPINPVGCSKDGNDLSGAIVDDVQRGGNYTWPPSPTHYGWGGMSAAVAQAEVLHRAGYPAYEWEQQAVRRGQEWLQNSMFDGESNTPPTDWMPWVVNFRYGTNIHAESTLGGGRLLDWTNWTHNRATRTP